MLEYMKNKYLKYKRYFFIVISIFIPIFIIVMSIFGAKCVDWWILGNDTYSNVSNEIWMGFLGSYIGSIIGGVITLIGVTITIYFTLKQSKREIESAKQIASEEREQDLIKSREERRLSIAPYIKYVQLKEGASYLKDSALEISYYEDIDDTENLISKRVILKNIGFGALVDLDITDCKFNGRRGGISTRKSMFGALEKSEEIQLEINVELKLEDITEKDIIEDEEAPKEYPFKFRLDDSKKKNGELSFKIKYKDLLANEYEQSIKVPIKTHINSNNSKKGWTYSKSRFCLLEIEPAKLISN